MRLNLEFAQQLLLLLSFVSVARSAAIEGNLEKALYQLPKCALSSCVAGNTTCICSDEAVSVSLVTCVRGSCGLNDQLACNTSGPNLKTCPCGEFPPRKDTLKVSKNACSQASRDKTAENRRVNWAMIALCTPFALLRLLSKVEFPRNTVRGGWLPTMPEAGWDDLCLLLAWFCTIVMGIIIGVPLQRAALGRDLWTLSKQQLIDTGYWIYVAEPIYMSSHAFLKASFLFFYLRVFGLVGSVSYFFGLCPMRPLLLGTLWVNLVIGIIIVGLSIGQCTPISYSWTQWAEDSPGSCIQSGQLLCATGDTTASSDNPGMMMSNSATWSMVESSVGIVCACLPGMRKFIVRTIPQAWSWAGRSLGSGTSGSTDAQRQQHDRHAPRSAVPRRLRTMSGSLLEPTVIGADDEDARNAPYVRISDDGMSAKNATVTTVGLKADDVESFAMADMKTGHETGQQTSGSTAVSSGGEGVALSRPFSAGLPSPPGRDFAGAETMSLPASPRIWTKPGSFNNYDPRGDGPRGPLPPQENSRELEADAGHFQWPNVPESFEGRLLRVDQLRLVGNYHEERCGTAAAKPRASDEGLQDKNTSEQRLTGLESGEIPKNTRAK
ncbi:hypothetical protein MGG_01867 [Pyricularia oryzae 70-15]|uniref:Rhodopsin domain-containing protein n=1 Tax=Pyricularia oryzae (strain 70-15 / ATCC MYA-4617 / FGSC 8958) TaxID=242507 RepID=G4MWM6_PYRO7|nr:uncharacterized protein MGG_01867 [Pyricularia oryzae 70-15]EHA55081.1 hypothetical protein MGG_01867 [Pyricularia oryzae 70-15]